MKRIKKNFAYIDAQNVYLSIQYQRGKLDWKKFRTYLKQKYNISKAYLFLGYIEENKELYEFFKKVGFNLIFKKVMYSKSGSIKGNVDTELVMHAMLDYNEYDKAVIVTGDGDFACLIDFLNKTGKLLKLIVPNKYKYSLFFKDIAKNKITSLTQQKKQLIYQK